jgi:hypothetical protein
LRGSAVTEKRRTLPTAQLQRARGSEGTSNLPDDPKHQAPRTELLKLIAAYSYPRDRFGMERVWALRHPAEQHRE